MLGKPSRDTVYKCQHRGPSSGGECPKGRCGAGRCNTGQDAAEGPGVPGWGFDRLKSYEGVSVREREREIEICRAIEKTVLMV